MKVCPSAARKNPIQHSICRVSRQAQAATQPNKHGGFQHVSAREQSHPGAVLGSPLPGRGFGVLQAGPLACYIGAEACFITRRAPSSPHLACGLNGSFFLLPCGQPNAALAGGLLGVVGWSKACGTLRPGRISLKAFKGSAVEGEGGGIKKSNFSNLPTETVWRPRIPWGLRLQKGVIKK